MDIKDSDTEVAIGVNDVAADTAPAVALSAEENIVVEALVFVAGVATKEVGINGVDALACGIVVVSSSAVVTLAASTKPGTKTGLKQCVKVSHAATTHKTDKGCRMNETLIMITLLFCALSFCCQICPHH